MDLIDRAGRMGVMGLGYIKVVSAAHMQQMSWKDSTLMIMLVIGYY